MRKTVILIRHAKAKDRSGFTEATDSQRPLTKAGKRALAAWLARAACLLELDDDPRIAFWASPAVRTQQTAEIARRAFARAIDAPIPDVELHDSLFDQDLGTFVRELGATDANVVFVAGHNPFMETACVRLCGARMPFGTGASCAISVEMSDDGPSAPSTPMRGRLLWFMQGPETARWKNLVDLENIVADAGKNVIARRDAFFADPADVETLHKLRVSIRTQRSLLTYLEPFQRKGQARAMQRDLRALVLETSHLRELDVLAKQVASLDPPATALLAACQRLRDEECARVRAVLSSPDAVKRFSRAEKQARRILWKRSVESCGLSSADLEARLTEMEARTDAQLAALDPCDAEQTHRVRKNAKKVRYAAERFGKLIDSDTTATAARMEEVQERFGALCDARVNVGIIDAFPTDGLPEEAQWDLSLLRTRNLELLFSTLRRASAAAHAEEPAAEGKADAEAEAAPAESGELAEPAKTAAPEAAKPQSTPPTPAVEHQTASTESAPEAPTPSTEATVPASAEAAAPAGNDGFATTTGTAAGSAPVLNLPELP
ncbi:MAG: CHAD domain-containing protein [Eggerthellaceae bacterium]|jgi:CHAD domain-containing protein/phosphohistidine phosphatase SixA